MVKKVKIIEAYYEPQTDTVNWNVETPEGETYPLCWPRLAYGKSVFSIKSPIPVKMIEENCQMMRGKEFFHEIRMVEPKKLAEIYQPVPKEKKDEASTTVRPKRVPKVPKAKGGTRKQAKKR